MTRLGWRRLSRRPLQPASWRIAGALLAVAGCLALAACSRPSAQVLNQDGNRAYGRGDFSTALEDYRKAQVERPDLAALNYNAGNVLYQQADYARGISESLRATSGNDVDARTRAFYSIGSDYYRQGKLKDALDAFKNALRLDPNDLDAKYNVEVIQRQLDAQAQQQQNQQSAQNQQGNQQNQQGQQNQQSQQGQQGQQGQQDQAGQQGQQGQQAAGQQQGASQAAQGNPGGQQGQSSSQSAAQPGGGGQPSAQSGNTGPSVREQQAQVNQDLQSAIDAYQKAPSIEEALRILDLIAQQDRLNQAAQGSRGAPNPRDK